MPVRRLDDIEAEKAKEKRETFKKEISEDVNDVIDNVFRKPKKQRKGFLSWIWAFLKFLGVLAILIIVLDLFLGSIWLLRFFIKSLFFS